MNHPTTKHPKITSCYWEISQLPGLDADNIKLLNKCGIQNTQQLLARGSNNAHKIALSNQLGINIRNISKWVAMSDLARVPSIGYQYCGVLLHSGVSSVNQLSQMSIQQLHKQILRLYVGTIKSRQICPSIDVIQTWIKQSQRLGKN
ncbi:MAG: DUF4332 domain-containing protein [Limnospira sp. PMC 1291.21]|uniref:DUF4332 domain-containing protein n=2 Tax=Limnospira TaxID=2596745 RepID=B5VUW3_LIMMA|nr:MULTISPECIES: DUF4332 domain-containing protein [Limnospira]EKD11382.1 hypothetical protein SPLC1_S032120 [Arthrospira platensis C1]MDC0837136.1 DUF4332 domain-containing protein [Limnoraphis robusta]MDY7053358.1 DUF4332 domain-containing protein [Limnospira fusiformis LS22]QJB27561.1 DUF4332 domain-containing protein [Limnospira fusiformis SAG 85.79]RAQ44918.1 DUF4332 domain-containing protein [Arthrospira sp. O9.13F]